MPGNFSLSLMWIITVRALTELLLGPNEIMRERGLSVPSVPDTTCLTLLVSKVFFFFPIGLFKIGDTRGHGT